MRKIAIFMSIIVVIAGWMLYLEHDKRTFIESLPQPPEPVNPRVNNSDAADSPPLQTGTNAGETGTNTGEVSSAVEQDSVQENSDSPVQENEDIPVSDDWRIDDSPPRDEPSDLWQQRESSVDRTPNLELSPDERANAMQDSYLEMFGDIPQVYAASEYQRKLFKNERMTIDEHIAGEEALFYLYPQRSRQMLEMLRTMKAAGITHLNYEVGFGVSEFPDEEE